MSLQRIVLTCLALVSCSAPVGIHAKEKPIRALLVAGGCCHDYTQQKKLLTEGISARANVIWSVVHEGDGRTDHRMSIYNDPDWAKNYDVVVHDECFSDVKDAEFVRNILKPHRAGLPAVNLHCAMHSYRVSFEEFKEWFEFTGIDSRAHGPHEPINLFYDAKEHPITKGLTNWSTGNEELYNALEVWPKVTPLLYGQQGTASNVVAWVNDYRGTRVFSTTVGHNNATVGDARYLDLVTRGLLWSVDKLNPTYLKPAAKRKTASTVRVPINLALNKKASAPASQEGRAPEMALDGNFETRWCAPDGGDNYEWQVDLGKPEEIVGVRIVWEHEGVNYQYTVAGSADGVSWKTLVQEKQVPRPALDEQRFSAQGIRHVKITVTDAPDGGWASFFEFEVLGKEMVERPASLFDPKLGGVQSPAGFDQTYFAGPPDINYPTCLEATPWGDVFVGVDQNGSLDRERNRGWVVRCRDTDGDGTADKFITFARMDSPRGLVFDGDTLYVIHPPFLSAWHDDNGDGAGDRSEILVSGLGKDLDFRGADHTCNGVRLGIDGFLYISLGDYGAQKAVGKDGKEVQVYGGGIVRVRPDGTDLEVVVVGTRNTYDVAIDPLMNLFTCDNTNDGDEWNLRLSHMIPTAHYGYPSLYKHFAKEIMPTMADYGGGSPTGAIFLDEPAFSDEFGHGLYTCQWGWNTVTRHPLKRNGATFAPEKETFVRIPRPTGIATDGLGNLFVASWKGAGFNYTGPNEGFVARISPSENSADAFPVLSKVEEDKLVEMLTSPSAVRRLHVQREILRRETSGALIDKIAAVAAAPTNSLAVRAAAVFTLGQIPTAGAGAPLLRLTKGSDLREFALRALADSKVASKMRAMIFAEALDDEDPRVRLQGIIALNRLGRSETAERILPQAVDPDPAVSHAAFRAIVSFGTPEPCLNALEKAGPAEAAAALRILGNMHQTRVADELIARLQSSPGMKMPLLETLCRLYYKEDVWDGSWWSTRPDSSGPYFKPVAWEGTPAIAAVLERELQVDEGSAQNLFPLFQKYKIERPTIPLPALENLVLTATVETTLRRKAIAHMVKLSDIATLRALAKADSDDKLAQEFAGEFVRDLQRSKNLATFLELARNGSNEEAELGWGIVLAASRNTNAPAEIVSAANVALGESSEPPTLGRARSRFFPHDNSKSPSAPGRTVATIPYDQLLKEVSATAGDAKLGAELFQTTGCVLCHTVAKDQSPSGPFLGDIAARYSVEEILESILKPNAKIAQGFETATIEDKAGSVFDGFVVRESGDELEIRNISGATVLPKKSIASRGTRATSIMPEGLADQLSAEQLASLVQYLQSLKGK